MMLSEKSWGENNVEARMKNRTSSPNIDAVVSIRGMAVEDTSGPLNAPAGKGCLSRMFDVFCRVLDRQREVSKV